MKTTLEIPDATFRRAKAKAAERGVALRQFVTEAVEEKLRSDPSKKVKPWTKLGGQLSDLHDENLRIDSLIREEFEQVDPRDWE